MCPDQNADKDTRQNLVIENVSLQNGNAWTDALRERQPFKEYLNSEIARMAW